MTFWNSLNIAITKLNISHIYTHVHNYLLCKILIKATEEECVLSLTTKSVLLKWHMEKVPEIMLQLRLFRYKISGCRTYWPKLLYLLKVKNILALQITFNYRDHWFRHKRQHWFIVRFVIGITLFT